MKSFIDFIKILKIFLKKYLPLAIRESRDELMFELGRFLFILAGLMLFGFCIFGQLMSPIAYYTYVAIMSILAFTGIILKAMFKEGGGKENV